MKYAILILSLLFFWSGAAQLPRDFRSEQIYLYPEKGNYMPGDTIALEGRVVCLSEKELLPYSEYLYVELFDENDSVLIRQKLACKEKGYFHTRLITGAEWPGGVYYLRAYTRLMRNFAVESVPVQPFLLGMNYPRRGEGRTRKPRCEIVPGGRRLAEGCLQYVAVWLHDELRYPIAAELFLRDERGDTLARLHTSASGLARFSFIPRPDTKYELTGRIDDAECRFALPEATGDTKIQGTLTNGRLSYKILNGKLSAETYRLYLYDRLNGLRELPDVRSEGIVALDNEPEVLSLFLTDQNLSLIAEYTVAGRCPSPKPLRASERLRVGDTLRFQLPDSKGNGRIFTRVVAEDSYPLVPLAEPALSYLSDYDSPIPFPLYNYESLDRKERKEELQTWLSTVRFKRFPLKEAVEKDTAIYTYMPEKTLTFGGWVARKSGHPFKSGTVVAYHTGNDLVYDVPIKEDGRFLMAVDDFEEGGSFFLQALSEKGNPEFADFHIDDETYPPVMNAQPLRVPKPYYAETQSLAGEAVPIRGYTDQRDGLRHLNLPDITVSARLLSDEPPVETLVFYSTNFADREKIEKWNYQTLYDILKSFAGIVIRRLVNEKTGELSWHIESTRGRSTLNSTLRQAAVIPILLDGVRLGKEDYDNLFDMSAREIESVELLRGWQTLAYTSGAIDGAILVKTRNYKPSDPLPTKGTFYTPKGLSSQTEPYQEKPWVATERGTYRLRVDQFTDSGIHSYETRFVVE